MMDQVQPINAAEAKPPPEDTARKKGWVDFLASQLTLVIAVGILALMTQTITSCINTNASIRAEVVKAQRALEADLIKKFVFVDSPSPQNSSSPQTVRANLQFLVDVGLVPDYADALRAFLDKKPDSALPRSVSAGFSDTVTGTDHVEGHVAP